MFTEQSGYIVKTVAVGSGQALQMGQEGNADVLFVHSPSAEKTLMTDGFGKERFLVMHKLLHESSGLHLIRPASAARPMPTRPMTQIYEGGRSVRLARRRVGNA